MVVALLVTVTVSLTASALEKKTAAQKTEEKWHRLTPEQQFPVVAKLTRKGQLDVAEKLLTTIKPRSHVERVIKRFTAAIILRERGKVDEAIEELRDIVAKNPTFTDGRLALAQTLVYAKQDASAKHHLKLLLGEATRAPNVANLASRYLSAIDNRRRWTASGFVTLAPSTNLNNGTSQRVVLLNGLPFQIADDNREKSGLGLAAGAQFGYRQPVSEKVDVVASVVVNGRVFRDNDFNQAFASLTVGPRRKFKWGRIGAFAVINNQWSANLPQSFGYGGLLSLQAKLGKKHFFSGDAQCLERNFNDDFDGRDLSFNNGHSCRVDTRLERQINQTTSARLIGSFGQDDTTLDHLDTNFWSVGGGVYKEFGYGLTIDGQVRYTKQFYDGNFPGSSIRRKDDRLDLSLQFIKRDLNYKGFAPQVSYTYSKNLSSVDFFDFSRHGANLTLTKRF